MDQLLVHIVKRNLREFQHSESESIICFPFSLIINYCPLTSGETWFCDLKERIWAFLVR